jgi:hypothetical protein
MDFLAEKWAEYWEGAANEYGFLVASMPRIEDHDLILILSTLLVIVVGNLAYKIMGKPKRWRARMTKEERREYEKRVISDAICDAIEDLVHKDKITENCAQHWYFLIGHRCGLTDLFPKPAPKPAPRPAADVKAEIIQRLTTVFLTKKPLPKPSKPKADKKKLAFERQPNLLQTKGA